MHRLQCGHLNCLRPFKYSQYWTRRGLGIVVSLVISTLYNVFGQINIPANLPIYVLMHLVNSKFLGRLYHKLPAVTCLFNAIQQSLLLLRNVTHSRPEENNTVKPHSHRKALLHDVYMCNALLRVRIFLLCIPLSTPFRRPVMRTWERGLTDKLQKQLGAKTLR